MRPGELWDCGVRWEQWNSGTTRLSAMGTYSNNVFIRLTSETILRERQVIIPARYVSREAAITDKILILIRCRTLVSAWERQRAAVTSSSYSSRSDDCWSARCYSRHSCMVISRLVGSANASVLRIVWLVLCGLWRLCYPGGCVFTVTSEGTTRKKKKRKWDASVSSNYQVGLNF